METKAQPLLAINRGMVILVQERDCIRVCVCVCVYLYADNYVVIRYLCVSMYVIIRVELHT